MNDKGARRRRYVRLLLEGFSPEEAWDIIKPKGRMKKQPSAGSFAESRDVNVINTCPNANQDRSAG
jgi:hypothetical protein